MAKWGEIKCPRCSAPPMSLWESMGRSLEEGDAREARLEARIEELDAKLAKTVEAMQFWSEAVEPDVDKAIALMDATLAELTGGKE